MKLAALADIHGNDKALRSACDVEKTIVQLLAARRPYCLWVAETLRRATHVPLATFE